MAPVIGARERAAARAARRARRGDRARRRGWGHERQRRARLGPVPVRRAAARRRAGLRGELVLAAAPRQPRELSRRARALLASGRSSARGRAASSSTITKRCGSRSAQRRRVAVPARARRALVRGPRGLDRRRRPRGRARALARSLLRLGRHVARRASELRRRSTSPRTCRCSARGPVIKSNANQSYATDGESWARFEAWCSAVGVAPQRFVVAERPAVRLARSARSRARALGVRDGGRRQPDALDALVPRDGGRGGRAEDDRRHGGLLPR